MVEPAELDELTDDRADDELIDAVADMIAIPKSAPPDSFVLHAPLELMARAALLPLVDPAERDRARRRIAWLGATYRAAGPPAAAPRHDGPPRDLAAAIRAGDMDEAWLAASVLAESTDAADLARVLAPEVVPRLAAAAHGPIFLHQLIAAGTVGPRRRAMLAPLARELARNPDHVLTWFRDGPATGGSAAALAVELRRPPNPEPLETTFIQPTMDHVERTGLAAELLAATTAGLTLGDARRALIRTAAAAMLQDAPDHAPYGWSHCLTMPHAVLGVGEAIGPVAVAVAATHVLGFRATLGTVEVDVDRALADAAPPADVTATITHAALHPDAHLAKYTLACLEAAEADPDARPLYLAAAAHLGDWWRDSPVLDDPILS